MHYEFQTKIPKGSILMVIHSYLKKAGKDTTEANNALVMGKLDRYGDDWTHGNVRSIIEKLGDELDLPFRTPLMARPVPDSELTEMLRKILKANPWIDPTVEQNGVLIAQAFFAGPPERSLQNMLDAVKKVSGQLKRTPPIPPQFEDEDLTELLSDGSKKLPLSVEAMRYSETNLQRRNLMDRLRRQEAWDAEQNQ